VISGVVKEDATAAQLREIAVKQSVGKLTEPENLPEVVGDAGFRSLPITAQHAVTAGRLRQRIAGLTGRAVRALLRG
jgi:PIN domain nuclease of toxin-antitoxin system